MDLGAYGNSAATLATSGQRIQLVEPGTYQKVEVGQPVDVRWITSGLTNPAPVLLMNAGGSSLYDTISGRWSARGVSPRIQPGRVVHAIRGCLRRDQSAAGFGPTVVLAGEW